MSKPKEPYPEHVKLKKISHLSQAQGDFIAWLNNKGIGLAKYEDHKLRPVHTPIQDLLAQYHGIDQKKLEAEKVAMLEALRNPRKK